MRKTSLFKRNLLFCSIMCFILLSPSILLFAEKAFPVNLPSWLTAEDASYLTTGAASTSTSKHNGGKDIVSNFLSKSFQNQFEEQILNYIPMRGKALIANASWQRYAIMTSNLLFCFPAYPTFYNSEIAFIPKDDRLLEIPTSQASLSAERREEDVNVYKSFAEDHPQSKIFICNVPGYALVPASPLYPLVSNALTYEDIENSFSRYKGSCTLIPIAEDYEAFLTGWNKTDHHWNMRGAFDAYQRIADALGIQDDTLTPLSKHTFDDPLFYGTFSRRSLDIYDCFDNIIDYEFSFPNMTIQVGTNEKTAVDLIHRTAYQERVWNANRFYNRYAELYHGDYDLIEIENKESPNDESLLIIGDSYTNCLEMLIASHFKNTYIVDPRHYRNLSVNNFLAKHNDVNKILFLMNGTNLLSETTLRSRYCQVFCAN